MFAEIFKITALLFWVVVKLIGELQMFQQNSYRNERYLSWLKKGFWNRWRIVDILAVPAMFVPISWFLLLAGVVKIRLKQKIALAYTRRVRRLLTTSIILSLAIPVVMYLLGISIIYCELTLIVVSMLSPIVVMVANIILSPVEKSINKRYYNDAKRILSQMPSLTIIGITGSYGKTSTKHFLNRILSEKYNVLMTPGNFNTTLGVVRTIREHLKPYHQIFIVEMGAKQLGDIREICELVSPDMGIITAVGEQHLETFGSIENIQKTKFELADALPENGTVVVNNDYEYIRNRSVENCRVIKYSMNNDPECDAVIKSVNYSTLGSCFVVNVEKEDIELSTKLLGCYNLSNILAACCVAKELGVDSAQINYAVSHLESVQHRLELIQNSKGTIIIDDAYNSNPHGAAMAMDVLKSFSDHRRVVITPGMVELGEREYFLNKEFGRQMAEACDLAIVVGQYNRAAITDGLAQENFPKEKVYEAKDLKDAVSYFYTTATGKDVVIYENDLPDTFK